MAKYGIVIDSTVYIPKKMIEENNIGVASLNVINGVDSYKEVDVNNQFIWDMQDKGAHWKTSQPAPGDFLELFETKITEGYDKVFVVVLSGNISGTYQSALLARKMLDTPEKIVVFNTSLCAYGAEMIAIELIEMVNSGKTEEEIEERISRIITTSTQMFTVENLFSLVKGGRLSVARAAIGTVLRVKPIIQVIDGKLQLAKSERTHKKIFNYFTDHIDESLKGYQYVTFYITSQNSLETATQVRELFEERYPGCKLTFTEYLGPVFSIHVGKKGYGISWFVE